jgi:ATP-binding cassette subfamily B protein IrtB
MMRRGFALAGRRDSRLIRGIAFKVIDAFFQGAPLGFLYLALQVLFTDTLDTAKLVWVVAGLGICLVLQGLFFYVSTRDVFLSTYSLMADMRLRLGEHLRHLPMGFFTTRKSGDLNAVLTVDVGQIEQVFTHIYAMLVAMIALPVFVACILFWLDWRMALAAVVTIPVAVPALMLGQWMVRRGGEKRAQAQIDVISRVIEYVQGIQVLKACRLVGARFQQLERALADFRKRSFELEAKPAPFILLYAIAIELGFVFVLLVGAYLLLGGSLTVPTFIMFLIVTLRFYHPLQQVGMYLAELRYFRLSFDRVQAVLDEPTLPEPPNDPHLDRFDIEFRDVSFRYEKDLVLDHVSFHIPERSVTALVGPSGSGKTTIANLTARFWDVTEGEVRIGGRNIKELRTDRLLSYISMVFQDVYLFHDTVLNNIRIGRPSATMEEVIAAARAAQCHEFIRKLPQGYDSMIGEGGATLSGGEKQRISIARAILKDAPIVLLDEATASLDPENEALIQKGFQALMRAKTLVVIAHRLSTIRHADQILVIDKGRIVERGTHEELIVVHGLYTKLWREQERAHGWKVAA